MLHLSLALVGQKVVVELTDGAIVEGIFHTFTPFDNLPAGNKNMYVLKEIRIQRPPSTSNGNSATFLKDGTTFVVAVSKVLYLHAKNVDLDRPDRTANNGTGGAVGSSPSSGDGFATDTQISGSRGGRDRELVAAGSAWTSSVSNGGAGNFRGQGLNAPFPTNSRAAALGGPKANSNKGPGGASVPGKLSGSIGVWDQFKANEELFNVNASFDENLYTTQLDLDSIDAKKVAEAERIAREIESSVTDNIHLAEERGQKIETDFRDEEDRYSTVLTQDGKQRHEVKAEDDGNAQVPPTTPSGPRKIMNYAAAAAKADPTKKTVPSVSSSKEKDDDVPASTRPAAVTPDPKTKAELEKTDATKVAEPAATEHATKGKNDGKLSKNEPEKDVSAAEEKKDAKQEVAKTSKLNANAKEFTFNPQAKAFTPGASGGVASSIPSSQQPPQHVAQDPNMHMYAGGHPMQPAPYMPAGHMGQPGTYNCELHCSRLVIVFQLKRFFLLIFPGMVMMPPQYGGMRYPPQYGRDQPMPPLQHHQGPPVHGAMPAVPAGPIIGNAPSTTGSVPQSINDDDSAPTQDDGSASTQQQQRPQQQTPDQQGQPQQQQQMGMPYGVPPGAYYPSTMMPRPGYTQFVTGPQQIPGRPGVAPYGVFPMQPGGMPPNMQMRGPNGAPYYAAPNGPMPYPPGGYMGHGMMDDSGGDPNFRGRGRGPGLGRGRGRGRGGRSGRGRGSYNTNHHQNSSGNNSGRNTPQQTQQQQHQSVSAPPQQQDPLSTEDGPTTIPAEDGATSKNGGEVKE
jgi:LsmAD domain/Ataxin 2 SM domain